MTPYSGIYNTMDSRYALDYAYRVLADHTRMCSVCIADGMYPQTRYATIKLIQFLNEMSSNVLLN